MFLSFKLFTFLVWDLFGRGIRSPREGRTRVSSPTPGPPPFLGGFPFFCFLFFFFRLCSLCNSVIVSRDGFLLFPLLGCLCSAKIGCAIQCCGCHPCHVQGLGTQICTLSAIVRHKVSGVPSCISRNRFLISKRAVRKSLLQADTHGAY